MTWSQTFTAAAGGTSVALCYVLEFVDGDTFNTATTEADGSVGETLILSSFVDETHTAGAYIAEGGIKVGSSSVTVGTWRYTGGTWSVSVVGDIHPILAAVTRGSLARLYVGVGAAVATMSAADQWEPVTMGVLKNIRGVHPSYTLEFWDLFTALASRRTTDPDKVELFSNIGNTTTTTADYTAGDVQVFFDTGDFEIPTARKGCIKIDNGTDDPVYFAYDTKAVNSAYGLTVIDGTDVDCPTGSTVTNVGYLRGKPSDILRQVLASTGDGSNGSYDLYPETWGFAIPDDWFDHEDLDAWEDNVIVQGTGTGAYSALEIDIIQEEPIEDGFRWLMQKLIPLGVWPVIRQGQISIRACQNYMEDEKISSLSGTHQIDVYQSEDVRITDAQIVQISEYSAFDPNLPAECAGFSTGIEVTTGSGGYRFNSAVAPNEWTFATLPAVPLAAVDLSGLLIRAPHRQYGAVVTEYRNLYWLARVSESLTIDVADLSLARLCPGDLIHITTAYAYGRFEAEQHATAADAQNQSGGFSDRLAMVTSVNASWTAQTVRLRLALPTMFSGAFRSTSFPEVP